MVSEWDIGGKDKRTMNEYAVERLLDALQSLTLEVQLFREAYVAHNSLRLERIDEPNCSEKPNNCEDEPQYVLGERFPSYITEDRTTQVLDGWQANPRTSTTAVEDEPQSDCPWK